MKKSFTSIFLILLSIIVLPSYVNALTPIKEIESKSLYKWYDNSPTWSNTEESPIGIKLDKKYKAGKDYLREYAFTRYRNVNTDDTSLEWKSSAKGMNQSGFIWERVRGIGKYNNEIAVRHEIYTYIYIYADNKEKIIGEKDPEFTYTIKMHNDNPNDVTNLYDITFQREDGEDPGTYKITPIIKPKTGTSISELIVSGTMSIGDKTNGRVYFYQGQGNLTIKEKKQGKVIVNYKDIKTNKIIDKDEIIGKVNEKYTTSPKQIDNYEYIEKYDGLLRGEFTEDDIVITYYYLALDQQAINTSTDDIITPPNTDINQ